MKAIVHIGAEKTGTTSIQIFLFRNRRQLSRDGFHLLRSAGKLNHWALPACCVGDHKFDDFYVAEGIRTSRQRQAFRAAFLAGFEEEIASLPTSIHTVLISSEHLHSRISTREEMARLHELLSSYFQDIRILCYLREQVAAATSLYSTSLKSGGVHSLQRFLANCTPETYYFNYFEVLNNWECFFGGGSLEVEVFDRACLFNGDLLQDFANRLAPALIDRLAAGIDAENQSISPGGQRLCLGVNRALRRDLGDLPTDQVRLACRDRIYSRMKGPGQQAPPSVREAMFDAFRDCNEQLRSKYFSDRESLFYMPNPEPAEEFRIDAKFLRELNAVFALINRQEGSKLTPEQCSTAYSEILAAVADPTLAEVRAEGEGELLALGESDARLCQQVARRLEVRDVSAGLRMMELAHRIAPREPGIRSELKRFRQKHRWPNFEQFFLLAYIWDPASVSKERALRMGLQMLEWTRTLDYAEGSPLYGLQGRTAVDPEDGQGKAGPGLAGYSIIRAASMEAALDIARQCPLREQLRIEVSRITLHDGPVD